MFPNMKHVLLAMPTKRPYIFGISSVSLKLSKKHCIFGTRNSV